MLSELVQPHQLSHTHVDGDRDPTRMFTPVLCYTEVCPEYFLMGEFLTYKFSSPGNCQWSLKSLSERSFFVCRQQGFLEYGIP